MIPLSENQVIDKITKVLNQITGELELDPIIGANSCPSNVLASQMLVTATDWISAELNITIPNSCYIFYDSKERRKLTIKEAAQKLISKATDGN